MEKIIHFTTSKNVSCLEAKVIERARELHPSWEIKVWQDPVQKSDFLLEKYWDKTRSGAHFADLLRLDILYRYGGVYVDSDLKLFSPLDGLIEKYDFFVASEDGLRATNALIGAQRENSILRYLIDQLLKNEPDWALPPNVSTGPEFFSRHLRWRNDVTVLPRETFYPYNWDEVGEKNIHRHSYGEHLWVGSWLPPEARAAALAGDNDVKGKRPIRRWIKQCIKKYAIVGFRAWNRIELVGRPRPAPQIKSYQSSSELIVQTIHGYNLLVDGSDVSLTPKLVFNGYFELPEENFIKNIVRGGDWVIDAGANIGSFSLLAAQHVGPFGRVFAYEPNPRPAMLMAKSLVMNWVHERVIQRPVALGDASGTVELIFVEDRLGDGRIGRRDITGTTFAQTLKTLVAVSPSKLNIPCVRLDDEFPVDLPIKLLKVDVEGYEAKVLAGAERLLRHRCVDYVIMETMEDVAGGLWEETLKQAQMVIDYGYAVCTLTDDGALTEQKDLAAAIGTKLGNIVLVAQEQYRSASSE
jgi:FkbM family methyltransferase